MCMFFMQRTKIVPICLFDDRFEKAKLIIFRIKLTKTVLLADIFPAKNIKLSFFVI